MLESAWEKYQVIWLSGVQKTGKTVLCKSIKGAEYFNCELPGTRRLISEPENFLTEHENGHIILDEIQRLREPSIFFKTALDRFPSVKILAIGSSAEVALPDFRDTFSERIKEIWLTPMMSSGLSDFDNDSLVHRLKAGGLPPFFLEDYPRENEFQQWMDSYWERDVRDNFRLDKRWSFQRFLEMIFEHSGEVFEASKYAKPCEISRPTVVSYLKIMESTFVASVIRPFSTKLPTEIVSAPKVYAFDTAFVCFFRGWQELHAGDLKILWEHLILNEIQSRMQQHDVFYWRDKHGHQVDFILSDYNRDPVAIECSWLADDAEIRDIRAFRRRYPTGKNWIIASDITEPHELSMKGLEFQVMGLHNLASLLEEKKTALTTR